MLIEFYSTKIRFLQSLSRSECSVKLFWWKWFYGCSFLARLLKYFVFVVLFWIIEINHKCCKVIWELNIQDGGQLSGYGIILWKENIKNQNIFFLEWNFEVPLKATENGTSEDRNFGWSNLNCRSKSLNLVISSVCVDIFSFFFHQWNLNSCKLKSPLKIL